MSVLVDYLHIGSGREMGKRQHCKGIWHAKEIRFRSDSILIVVQIQVGSVRATAKVTEWVSLFIQFVLKKKRGRTLRMSGTDTTSSTARRPQEEINPGL